jgi:hyperosmotically inducible protein
MPKIVLSAALVAVTLLAAGCERPSARARYPAASDATTAPMAQRAPADLDPSTAPSAPAVPKLDTLSRDDLSDTMITARVRGAILTDPALSGADVSVNTVQGVVNLTGSVSSQEQAAIASSHAQRPDGVMRIENHLVVAAR